MIRSLFAAATLAAALALPSPDAARAESLGELLEGMSETEREAFRAEIRAYLLDNPEVILEAIDVLESRRAVAAAAADRDLVRANAAALLDDGYSFVAGNPDGDVTVVEFLDYRCGFCKRAHPHVIELLERDPGVRLVEKQFPILGPDSLDAARVAMAALELDPASYGALTAELMEYRGDMTEQVALRIAGTLGYDVAVLKEAAADPAIEARISQTYELARSLGIQGTPSFVIGSEIIRGFLPVEDLAAAVAEARSATN